MFAQLVSILVIGAFILTFLEVGEVGDYNLLNAWLMAFVLWFWYVVFELLTMNSKK